MAAQPEAKTKIHQEGIQPFWQKVPQFLMYPMHGGPLTCIGILSVASIVTAFTGGLFRGLIAYLFLRYAFSVMEQHAAGDSNPDSPDISMWGGKDYRPLKQTVVFIFYFLILFGLATMAGVQQARTTHQAARAAPAVTTPASTDPAARQSAEDDEEEDDQAAPARSSAASPYTAAAEDAAREPEEPEVKLPAWFYLAAILCALPLPGAVMVIALEDSLVRALNPLTTVFFMRAMGGAYFILWFLFAAIFTLREIVTFLLADASAFIRLPAETFLGSYLMLALFAMMGYALYQYHQELGYDVKVDFDTLRKKEKAAADTTKDPLMRQVNALLADGKQDDALRMVLDGMRYDKTNVDLNARAAEIYTAKGEPAKALVHTQSQLKGLVAAKQGTKALSLLKKLRAADPAFAPDADARLPLAEASYAARDFKTAVDLVKGFDKQFPDHADIPGVYFLGARVTSEQMRDDVKATLILMTLLKRYPDAPVAAEAKQYLDVLKKMARSKPAPAAAG